MADEIVVMYAGRVVGAPTRELFYDPQMPYTWGLLGSIPRLDGRSRSGSTQSEGRRRSSSSRRASSVLGAHAFDKCMEEPGGSRTASRRLATSTAAGSGVDKKRSLREATIRGDQPGGAA